MSELETIAAWWRPDDVVRDDEAQAASPREGGRVAFGALVTFTVILMLSPQVWFPVLKSLRIAFVAAGVAIGAHLLERAVERRSVTPSRPEMAIALALVCWAVVTIPLSYWPGGSVEVLTDHFLKAVAFFWLIGTVVTTPARLSIFAWTLVLCSIPLAGTALAHFQSGVYMTSDRAAVQRIAGYMGGSGLTGNPNDLALMLNLLLPIAGALVLSTRRAMARAVAAGALMLSIGAVIVTFSRAGFLTLAAIFVMSVVTIAKRRAPGAASAILVIALCVPPLLPEGYFERLDTITDISTDPTGSAQGRWNDITAASEAVSRHPMTGVGIGQDILVLNELRGPTWRAVHNVYLEYAIDLGLPGLTLFIWLFLSSVRSAARGRRRLAQQPAHREATFLAEGVQIALIAFGVAAFFYPIAYQFYFFCVAGLAVAVKNASGTAARRTSPRGSTATASFAPSV